MSRRPAKNPSPDRERTARRLATACGTSLLAAGLAAPSAAAAPAAGRPGRAARADDTQGGSGRHNNNTFTVRSPTRNQGYQHTNSGNAGGENSVQNALCRGARVCHVTQYVTIIQPVVTMSPEPGTSVVPPVASTSPAPRSLICQCPGGVTVTLSRALPPSATAVRPAGTARYSGVPSHGRAAVLPEAGGPARDSHAVLMTAGRRARTRPAHHSGPSERSP